MKQYTIIAIILMLAVLELPALEKTAYTVQIENADKGKITVPVPKLELGQYQSNEIFIKTKEVESFDEKGFISPLMQNAFDNITINKLNKISKNVKNDQKISKLPVNRLYKVNYKEPVDAYDMCQELMKNPAVEYAVPVFNRYVHEYTPDDPNLHGQWHLENINAEEAWEITKGSEDIVIGIVDSGTDWEHLDLVDNMYVNEDEIPFNGEDDDGNGYVDDVNGWDFVGNVSFNQVLQGQFNSNNDPKPVGNNDHGTHVAGCASAVTDNGRGIAGIGFNTKLLPVKCASDNWNSGVRGIYRAYEGIVYAAENGADIVNCSWGGPGFNPAEQEIINSVVEMGVLIVASAGNDGVDLESGQFYPANYNNILCVGSTRNNNSRAGHSNWGYRVDVYSPGQGILSTVLNDDYSQNTGTSMAGPIVAGVAALVKAVNPDWLPHQIASQIRTTSMPLNNVSDAQKPLFYGRVNAFDAVSANANDFSNKRRLGMGVSESDFASGEILNSYESNEVSLKLVNYLAPVQGVRISFTPLDKFVEINADDIILNDLEIMDTTDLKVEMNLTDKTPWFDGVARVLISYEAPGYEDYQLLRIPVSLPSNNSHRVINRFPEGIQAEFHHIHSPTMDSYWAVGSTRSNQGIIYNSSSNRIFSASNQMATGVYALSSSEAWVTTGSNNMAEIKYTSNGGSSWESTNVSDETNFLNGIHFFDEDNGIAFGDPKGGSHCLLITEDGGDSWSRNTNVSPETDENGLVGSFGTYGGYIWIGTTQGRVLKGHKDISSWRVNSLEEASTVLDIAFESEKDGLAIYSLHSNNDILLARSNDGGLNWDENELNFSQDMNIDPVSIIYKEDVESIFIICKKGEVYYTNDLGQTWVPVLSRTSVAFQRGTISNDFDQFKMYGIGEAGFASLEFSMIPEGAEAHLQVQPGDKYTYDDTEVGKASLNSFDLVNDGDITVFIENIYLDGDDAEFFSFFGDPPTEINRGGSNNVIVRFTPEEKREYNAQLVIESNNEDGDITVNLSGTGIEKVFSVPLTYINSVQTYPNPVKNEVNVEFISDLDKMLGISLIDNNGKTIKNLGKQVINSGQNHIKIDTENLISGTYFILFESEEGSFIQKIIRE